MLKVLAVVVPLALAGAFSPVMLSEQMVLLAGPGGRGTSERYAAGAALTLLAFASALVLFGRSISLPQEPHLDATLDLVLGAALAGIAAILRWGRPRERRRRHVVGRRAALAFGAASMATNVTTLAVVVPAAKEIAASDLDAVARAAVVVVVVAIASAPAWAPVALTQAAPGPAGRGLGWLADVIARRGRSLTTVALAALGTFLVVRGVVRLAGL